MSQVTMCHPAHPGDTPTVNRVQFERVWKPKGWVEVTVVPEAVDSDQAGGAKEPTAKP